MNKVLFLLILLLLIGCGADEGGVGKGGVFEISDETPVISVKKITSEIKETQVTASYCIVADRAPKTDLLVRIEIGEKYHNPLGIFTCGIDEDYYIVTIPDGEKQSQVFNVYGGHGSINGSLDVFVNSLPIVYIVGQGEMVDQQTLRKWYGGDNTEEGNRIPDDHTFTYYIPATHNEYVYLYQAKDARIIDVQPKNGSRISYHPVIDRHSVPHSSRMICGKIML